MAKVASKGTVLKLSIASVYTTVVAVDSISGPDVEVETGDTTALDSAVGREMKPTGYVKGGSVSFSGWFDPVAVTHQALTDLITTPAVASWKIVWSDTALTEWLFSGTFGGLQPTAAVGEHLKFDASIILDGMVSYPT